MAAALGATTLGVTAFAAAPAADSADAAYAAAQSSYKSFKADEKKKQFSFRWHEVIDKFKAVADKFPKSAQASDALFTEGTLYYDLHGVSGLNKDLESAAAAWSACAQKYPKASVADDALLGVAKADHALGKHADELDALQSLIASYPKGDQLAAAKKLLPKAKEEVGTTAVAAASPEPSASAAEATPAPSASETAVSVESASPAATPATSGGTAGATSVELNKVKVWSNPGWTRVAIYADGDAAWLANALKANGDKPPRIYVDLTKARVAEALTTGATKGADGWQIPIGDGLLTQARVAQYGPDTVRVVLDVASMDHYSVLELDDPFRLVLDVYGAAPTAVAVAPTPMPLATDGGTPEDRLEQLKQKQLGIGIPLSQQLGLKFTRIYVDAGHGGKDTGAIGPDGLMEKDVTLAIAKDLVTELKAMGYDAILTRTNDTFLALEDRSGIANEGNGDLFISVHCNAKDPHDKIDPEWVETYYAMTANDRASARLAAIENATNQESMSGLDAMLEQLARGEHTDYSGRLALAVQQNLSVDLHRIDAHSRADKGGVKTALFYVLLTAKMPAILVETSFISTRRTEKVLADGADQKKIAQSIAKGIDSYIDAMSQKRPPPPTDVAAVPIPTPERRDEAPDPHGR